MRSRFKLAALVAALSLAGCASEALNQAQSESLDARSRSSLRAGGTLQESNSVTIVDKVVLPMVAIKEDAPTSWLAHKRVRLLNDKRRQLSLTEVVKMFFDQGINISSSIPLDNYTYAGLGVHDADAESALRSILGAVGLDYELDDATHSVLIRPLASRSWKINLGDRKTSFVATGNANSATSSENGQQGQTGGQQNGSMGGETSINIAQQSEGNDANGTVNKTIEASSVGASGGSKFSYSDDFWASLRAELKDRMEVLLPGVAPSAAIDPNASMIRGNPTGLPLPSPMPSPIAGLQAAAPAPSATAGSADFYVKKRIGTFAINPVTGYVTVQAPRWLLNDLDKYISRIQAENNYLITFVGEMVLVTTNKSSSEGLDISSFATFANKRYGVAYTNNALGGVTVNFPTDGVIPNVAAGGQAVANTLLGIRSPLDGLQVFNAYLENFGTVNVVQKPIVATSNGVPGYFSRTSRKYFVQYSQTAAAGNTGAATVGTQNSLIPFDFGTTLTILPRYDSEKDIVRADIILDQVVQAGTQSIPQQVSSGGSIQQVNQDIPLAAKFGYRGEVPLRDGDLIIIGGQTEDETNSSDGGVTGLKNSPLSAVFGQKAKTNTTGTYYFALRVKLTKRD